MKIFDCFTFFNELDVLEIRLHELKDVVDFFVLVESDVTHSGKVKNLVFEENKTRFAEFLDRIIHVKVSDMPRGGDAWKRENFQRNAILRGLDRAAAGDLIVISDVDEIPRASVLKDIAARKPGDIFALKMRFFTLRLNYLLLNGSATHLAWSAVVPFQRLAKPQDVRNDIARFNARKTTRARLVVVEEGGWHFSSIGDDEHVKKKIAAYAHQEGNIPSVLDNIDVEGALARGLDMFGREDYFWSVVPVDVACPSYVAENVDRYRHIVAAEIPLDAVISKAIVAASRQREMYLPTNNIERAVFKLFGRSRF